MADLNLAVINKKKEQKNIEELTQHQMDLANAGADPTEHQMAVECCNQWCQVSNDDIGELIYFVSV